MKPLVTIVTPTYNQERFLGTCIDSVLAQSYENWEQIIVDDGSTDGTQAIVRSYSDPRIRYVRLPHRGLPALGESYNTALGQARGSLVAVLEGDDLWPADKLEIQVPVFTDESTVLSWGRARLVGSDGAGLRERAAVVTMRERHYFDTCDLFARLTRVNLVSPAATVVLRRDALERVGGFRQAGTSLFVDLPTWLAVTASNRGRAVYLNSVVGCYRVYGEQTSAVFRSRMEAEHLDAVLELERTMDPELLESAGWNPGMRRRAETGGLLARGSVELSEGSFGAASRSFRHALVRARSASEGGKAAIGLASAVFRRDLLAAAYSARDRAASRLGRVRTR